jgi:hypothetical protein
MMSRLLFTGWIVCEDIGGAAGHRTPERGQGAQALRPSDRGAQLGVVAGAAPEADEQADGDRGDHHADGDEDHPPVR